MNNPEKVNEFHKVFGHPTSENPKLITKERALQRMEWVVEELEELMEAIRGGDIVAAADAVGDAEYFIHGFWAEMGLSKKAESIFSAIHEANMSKICVGISTATRTKEYYQKQGRKVDIEKLTEGVTWNSKYAVKDSRTGKILKSVDWFAPEDNIKKIIEDGI